METLAKNAEATSVTKIVMVPQPKRPRKAKATAEPETEAVDQMVELLLGNTETFLVGIFFQRAMASFHFMFIY